MLELQLFSASLKSCGACCLALHGTQQNLEERALGDGIYEIYWFLWDVACRWRAAMGGGHAVQEVLRCQQNLLCFPDCELTLWRVGLQVLEHHEPYRWVLLRQPRVSECVLRMCSV